jgi:predicted RNase H-like nuclease
MVTVDRNQLHLEAAGATVLGVDAAWTLTHPSGVALVTQISGGWRLVAWAPSYQQFLALADHSLISQTRPVPSKPDPAALLRAATNLTRRAVDLIAVDMPLARLPIVARRASDDAVSRAYGARHASTHTPSATRLGVVSDELRAGFERAGYPLQTDRIWGRGLIEVYPHPALIELAAAPRRLPYKAAKVRSYWPDLSSLDRRGRLFAQWAEIVRLLDLKIAGVANALPVPDLVASGVALKAFEDVLDAIVCAWVGACALEGHARPFGCNSSAPILLFI